MRQDAAAEVGDHGSRGALAVPLLDPGQQGTTRDDRDQQSDLAAQPARVASLDDRGDDPGEQERLGHDQRTRGDADGAGEADVPARGRTSRSRRGSSGCTTGAQTLRVDGDSPLALGTWLLLIRWRNTQ